MAVSAAFASESDVRPFILTSVLLFLTKVVPKSN